MTAIQNFLDVKTLFLTWQSNQNRQKRYFVGSIVHNENNEYCFSYNINSNDYKEAREEGYTGYPAFKLGAKVFTNNVIETFMKRLPPRSRKDFKKYLSHHYLSEDFNCSDFVLISHTGVQLPSDGFDLMPDLSEASIPFEYLMEVAGTRHNITFGDFDEIELDSNASLVPEPANTYDCNAIAIHCNSQRVGYVNRLLCTSIHRLIETRSIDAVIAKKSGTSERPLLYLMLKVR
ncbi:MAG: hypothetical protein COB67_04125 [SAR324 cluster bacterium]|uniref:HIRAN domain-containing protein n=1 Tax=SAR324 cluster bacterium TaxID=2024889 RepID=A0A2A4T727_9DELT|nr:MAG: hypothetical protein COB67_04125 [SAR324 cluster bacterium]